VVHWADGGATSAENLALLCRHHHGTTHRSGWTMTTDPDRPQRFTWTRPDGRTIRSQRATDHARAAQAARATRETSAAGVAGATGPPGTSRE